MGAPHPWVTNRKSLTSWIVVLMVLAVLKLTREYPRLLWAPLGAGGKDLSNFYGYVQGWFVGTDIYGGQRGALYPPASMVMAWPLLGWLPFPATRWLWCIASTLGLVILVWLVVRSSGASGLQKLFIGALVVGTNATGVIIGNGQSTLYVLPLLLGGVLVLWNAQSDWRQDILGALLILGGMFKPSLAIPFLPLVIIYTTGIRWRPIAILGVLYVALTLFAARYQSADLVALFRAPAANGTRIGMYVADGNLLYLMRHLGLVHFALPVSAVVVGWLGWWTYKNRQQDLWVLLGVAAIVARMWTYHRVYDNLVIVFASVALFRIAAGIIEPRGASQAAGRLLAATSFILLPLPKLTTPDLPEWFFRALIVAQSIIWLADFVLLLKYCGKNGTCFGPAPSKEAQFQNVQP